MNKFSNTIKEAITDLVTKFNMSDSTKAQAFMESKFLKYFDNLDLVVDFPLKEGETRIKFYKALNEIKDIELVNLINEDAKDSTIFEVTDAIIAIIATQLKLAGNIPHNVVDNALNKMKGKSFSRGGFILETIVTMIEVGMKEENNVSNMTVN